MKQWFILRVDPGRELSVCADIAVLATSPLLASYIDRGIFPSEYPGYVILVAELAPIVHSAVLRMEFARGFVKNASTDDESISVADEGDIWPMSHRDVEGLMKKMRLFTVEIVSQ